jgi:transposase
MFIFPEKSHLKIEQINRDETLTVFISSTEATAVCTTCGTTATHIHSRYQRRLHDLPVSGYPVKLLVEVRRFFCQNRSCPRKTFAEAFGSLARRSAQRTNRLQEALQHLGLALGAEAGARVGAHLGYASSPSSLLRLLRSVEPPARSSPATIIGIDDWAYKRRRRFGTLICDLETGKPLELLPDRSVQTVCTWLQAHPEIKVISRDRWSEYATAAQKGAPQATQVADRWHVLHNLSESVCALFARMRADLNASGSRRKQSPRSAAQEARQAHFIQIQDLHRQGLSPEQIALHVGVSERTIYRWLQEGQVPSGRHEGHAASVVDPYQAYLEKRWRQGCRKGSMLCRELKAQGYRGSERAVYRALTRLQASSTSKGSSKIVLSSLTAKQATWLLMKQQGDLDTEEQQQLLTLRQASVTAETVYQIVQAFEQFVRERQGERLEHWLKMVEQSALPELQTFAAGIKRDYAAVRAALTLPYSNGPLEGHINRLKLIKRSMYGRAKFDLLRLRVLCAA